MNKDVPVTPSQLVIIIILAEISYFRAKCEKMDSVKCLALVQLIFSRQTSLSRR